MDPLAWMVSVRVLPSISWFVIAMFLRLIELVDISALLFDIGDIGDFLPILEETSLSFKTGL